MIKEPKILELEKNKEYYFCTCGQSTDVIFCNGAHRETTKNPKLFTVDKSKEYSLCGCKHSSNFPFCDGSHKENN